MGFGMGGTEGQNYTSSEHGHATQQIEWQE